MTRILTTVATIAATTLMSSAAFANCNSTYCTSGSQLSPLSSWSSVSSYESAPSYSSSTSYSLPATTYGSTSYSSGTYDSSAYGSNYSYGISNSYGGTLSSAEADATYGTGSISSAYEGGDVELFGFSGSTASVPGLGLNESLQATNCPVNVHNPDGARVLGCYNVVKPVPQTSYYQVVRPVVYVRYPVPVAVPYYSGCSVVTNTSRYGSNFNRNNGRFGRRCG